MLKKRLHYVQLVFNQKNSKILNNNFQKRLSRGLREIRNFICVGVWIARDHLGQTLLLLFCFPYLSDKISSVIDLKRKL